MTKRLPAAALFLAFFAVLALPAFGGASVSGLSSNAQVRSGVYGAEAASSGGATTLFRAVSPEEYAQLMKTGQFAEGTNSLGGKFFAESAADAAKWGDAFTKGQGGYRIISATMPDSAASSFMRWESLDAIGPARYAELEQVNVPGLVIGTVK